MAELRELTYAALPAAQAVANLLPVPSLGPSIPGTRIGRTVPLTAAVEPIPSGAAWALFLTEDQAGSHPSIRGQSIAEVVRTVPDPGARIRDEVEPIPGGASETRPSGGRPDAVPGNGRK